MPQAPKTKAVQTELPIRVNPLHTIRVDAHGHPEFLPDGSYHPFFCPQSATTQIIKL